MHVVAFNIFCRWIIAGGQLIAATNNAWHLCNAWPKNVMQEQMQGQGEMSG